MAEVDILGFQAPRKSPSILHLISGIYDDRFQYFDLGVILRARLGNPIGQTREILASQNCGLEILGEFGISQSDLGVAAGAEGLSCLDVHGI